MQRLLVSRTAVYARLHRAMQAKADRWLVEGAARMRVTVLLQGHCKQPWVMFLVSCSTIQSRHICGNFVGNFRQFNIQIIHSSVSTSLCRLGQ